MKRAFQTHGRYWLAVFAIGLAFWLAFLGSLFAAGAFAACQTHKCWARVSQKRHQHFWVHRFNAQPSYWRSWAWLTGNCESRNRANTNTGNGFYGAFQFTLQTAWAAGFHRRPDLTTWHEQALRSIRYAQAHGTSAWPVCG